MEIREVGDISRPHQQGKEGINKKIDKLSPQGRQDKIDISLEAKRMPRYVELVKNLPRVRQEKVETVKKKIAKGDYQTEEITKKTIKKLLPHIL